MVVNVVLVRPASSLQYFAQLYGLAAHFILFIYFTLLQRQEHKATFFCLPQDYCGRLKGIVRIF